MRKNIVRLALCAFLFTLGVSAHAQQPAKIPRIGLLGGGSASANAGRIEGFRQGLRELGYVEGKNIVIEYRWAEGKLDRLPALAAELVRLKVDIIVSAGPTVTRVAKEATVTIPIVMGFDDDPVGSGFVASLARPGGNITGLSALSPELSGKQLELLKEIIPKLSRVAVIGSSTHPGTVQSIKEMEFAAAAFKVQLQNVDVLDPKDIETAFGAASKGRADAVLVLTSVVTNSHRKQIVELAVKNRLPAIYYTAEWVEAGGLMTYGASFTDLFRTRGYVCGQDPQRCQPCRSPSGAGEEVRVHRQCESGEADRPDDPTECAGKGGQGHKMIFSIFDCRF
jgi:putative ABC transport system substrate-binding protein